MRVCNGLQRIKAFPRLAEGGRTYCPEQFDFKKVKQFLAKGRWERKVSQAGQVEFGNQRYTLGKSRQGNSCICPTSPIHTNGISKMARENDKVDPCGVLIRIHSPIQLPTIRNVFRIWITSVPAQAMPKEISNAGREMVDMDSAVRTGTTK